MKARKQDIKKARKQGKQEIKLYQPRVAEVGAVFLSSLLTQGGGLADWLEDKEILKILYFPRNH